MASGLAENLPSRSLVNGMMVMVNRNAKFHQARPSCCPGDPAEDPVVNEPELGDDVERDNVTDQLVRALPELGGELGGRVGVGERGRGWHVQLQDQQGDSDGHHAVRQGEQAVHARQVAARAGGDGIGRQETGSADIGT